MASSRGIVLDGGHGVTRLLRCPRMFRRTLLTFLAVGAVALALWRACEARVPPEEKIRRCIEAQLDGLHRGQARPILDGLADSFVDRSSGATRDDVRRTLFLLLREATDAKTGEFDHVGTLAEEDGLEIELASDGESARVRLHVLFHRRGSEPPLLTWDARIEGELRPLDGWQWVRTESVNHSRRRWGL
jgi:hypothetical protein